MNRSLAVIAGIFLLNFGSALASDWRLLDNSEPDGVFPAGTTEFDADTVSRKGTKVTYWERNTFEKPVYINPVFSSLMTVNSQKIIDCKERTIQVIVRVFSDDMGKTIHTNFEPQPSQAIVPDSVAETYLDRLCVSGA
jgi:hypothetical protein